MVIEKMMGFGDFVAHSRFVVARQSGMTKLKRLERDVAQEHAILHRSKEMVEEILAAVVDVLGVFKAKQFRNIYQIPLLSQREVLRYIVAVYRYRLDPSNPTLYWQLYPSKFLHML